MVNRRRTPKGIFNESYFEHNCVTVKDEDELNKSIKGNGCWPSLQRWWYDLFLAAYDDERCRMYYRSSHELQLARDLHFLRHRYRIHPLSKFTAYWSLVLFLATTLDRIFLHHNSTVLYPAIPMPFAAIGLLWEFILLLDIIIKFQTGYIDLEYRKVVLNWKKGCMHYCSTKLFLDVISSLPIQLLLFLRYGNKMDCNDCKANITVSVLKIISCTGLYRVVDSTHGWSRERRSRTLTDCLRLLRVVVLAIIARLQLLVFVDAINILIMIHHDAISDDSYLELFFFLRNSLPPSLIIAHELAVIFRPFVVFKLSVAEGYKFVFLDNLMTLLSFMLTAVFMLWAMSEMYRMVHRRYYIKDREVINKVMTINLLRQWQVDDHTMSKVNYLYNSHSLSKTNFLATNPMYGTLPLRLTKELKFAVEGKYFKNIPYFKRWPDLLLEEIAMNLREEIFMENEVVLHAGIPGEGLVILKHGICAVYSPEGLEVGHLIDGDYFGEVSLVTNTAKSGSDVIAVTHSTVSILTKDVFRRMMRQYPELFYKMRTQVFRKILNDPTEGDIYDSFPDTVHTQDLNSATNLLRDPSRFSYDR